MRKFYSALFLTVIFFACKSPAKLYDKGNYNDAMDAAIKKLQKDPGNYESREVMKNSYKYAVEDHEDQIRILSNSSSENKYDEIFQEYTYLQGLYDKIRRYPAITQFIKPKDYSSYIETYRDKAFSTHLEKADKWMEGDDRRSYREAYYEFRKALRYKPEDFDTKKKLEDAYDAAVVNVMVVPIDAMNGNYYYSNNSSYQMRNFQDELIRNLNYNSSNEFVKYYTEWSTDSKRIQPDEVLEMRMGRMNMGQPYDQSSSKQVSKEVVVKEKVYSKDSVVKEYAKVYATITTTKRTLVSDVDMYVTAREPRGKILWSDNLRSEHQWRTEFSTYTGDERALSNSDKNLLNKKDQRTPNQEGIANDLLSKLQSDLSHKLRNYYTRYQ
jgi:hypothetical protein